MNFTESLRFLNIPLRKTQELPPTFKKDYPQIRDTRLAILEEGPAIVLFVDTRVWIESDVLTSISKRHIRTGDCKFKELVSPACQISKSGQKLKLHTRIPGLTHLFKAT